MLLRVLWQEKKMLAELFFLEWALPRLPTFFTFLILGELRQHDLLMRAGLVEVEVEVGGALGVGPSPSTWLETWFPVCYCITRVI